MGQRPKIEPAPNVLTSEWEEFFQGFSVVTQAEYAARWLLTSTGAPGENNSVNNIYSNLQMRTGGTLNDFVETRGNHPFGNFWEPSVQMGFYGWNQMNGFRFEFGFNQDGGQGRAKFVFEPATSPNWLVWVKDGFTLAEDYLDTGIPVSSLKDIIELHLGRAPDPALSARIKPYGQDWVDIDCAPLLVLSISGGYLDWRINTLGGFMVVQIEFVCFRRLRAPS